MSLKIKDEVSPDLRRKAQALRDRQPVLEAMGEAIVNLTIDAFRNAALRALPWPLKKDGSPATLHKKGALVDSIRVVEVSNNSVTVGSDRPYAAIHQLGGQTKPHVIKARYAGALYFQKGPISLTVHSVNHPGSKIPARPFFPFRPDGTMLPAAREKVEAVGKLKVDKLLGL